MNVNSSLTISNWLQGAQKQLKTAGIGSYPLDSLLLLEHVTDLNKAHILAHQDQVLTDKQLTTLSELLERRTNREPLAYITSVKEFYGRDFYVNQSVLIPRPESESFIELLKQHGITHQSVIDVGSGSGILGITTKLELPTNQVTMVDISKTALEIAKRNAHALSAECSFMQNDLLPLDSDYSVVLANLPYVPKNMSLEPELDYEPALALFADNNGMALYEHLWQQISRLGTCRYVLTESLKSQHDQMTVLAQEAEFELAETDELVQLFRQDVN